MRVRLSLLLVVVLGLILIGIALYQSLGQQSLGQPQQQFVTDLPSYEVEDIDISLANPAQTYQLLKRNVAFEAKLCGLALLVLLIVAIASSRLPILTDIIEGAKERVWQMIWANRPRSTDEVEGRLLRLSGGSPAYRRTLLGRRRKTR
ncbi:MAG: hypothetical protein WC675_00380 [Patescibacteria group bacterium]|jgi:hypothetical protein